MSYTFNISSLFYTKIFEEDKFREIMGMRHKEEQTELRETVQIDICYDLIGFP